MWSECDCVIYQRRTRGEGQLRPWHGHRCEHHWCVLNTDFPIPRRRESLQRRSVGPRLHQSQKRAGSIRSERLQHFYYNTHFLRSNSSYPFSYHHALFPDLIYPALFVQMLLNFTSAYSWKSLYYC